jgi:thiol-disulfide isomerase/thioredoxin
LGAVGEIVIPAPTRPEDAEYLGLPAQLSEFALTDIKSPVILIQVFDMYCMLCQKQAPEVNRLFQLVQESELKDRVRFLGIGKKNTQTEADIFRDRYDVEFPLFPDPQNANVTRIGEDKTPSFTIIHLENGEVLNQQWKIESAEQLLEKLKLASE